LKNIKGNYKINNGCHNCKLSFIFKEFGSATLFFCANTEELRPPCGSIFLKEEFDKGYETSYLEGVSVNELKKKESLRISVLESNYKAWERWSEDKTVDASGICDNWIKK